MQIKCIGQQLLETVIPAKTGIHSSEKWIPAFAGMTIRGNLFLLTSDHYNNADKKSSKSAFICEAATGN